MPLNCKISITGLGYVGLPLAIAFSKHFSVVGFDHRKSRIIELQKNIDRTNEIESNKLKNSNIKFTSNSNDLKLANFHIVAVPTPLNSSKTPDLSMIIEATETIAKQLSHGDIVVYESTVYPGLTEELCIPLLEKRSGLKCEKDFNVGYSPERINPGDKEHSIENIIKIVSAQNDQVLATIAEIYGTVVKAGIFKAKNIRVAEAAKAIENAQRDLNVAFMNELAQIFHHMGINTRDVLEAARTKWNFLPFEPGLVGGHCIGVDPYYLTFKAEQYNFHPEIILAGRRINDSMGKYIASETIKLMAKTEHVIFGQKVAILGITFKENCPDIRNTRVIDIVSELRSYGVTPIVCDPIADSNETIETYDIQLTPWEEIHDVAAIIIAVAHDQFRKLSPNDFIKKLKSPGIICDIKSIVDKRKLEGAPISYWSL